MVTLSEITTFFLEISPLTSKPGERDVVILKRSITAMHCFSRWRKTPAIINDIKLPSNGYIETGFFFTSSSDDDLTAANINP